MTNIISLADARQAKAVANDPVSDAGGEDAFGSKQLFLSFGAIDHLLLVDVRNFVGQDDFLYFCTDLIPSAVVDLRVAPRLDFIRPSRKQAFELFDALNLEYVDVLGRLNIFSCDVSDSVMLEIITAVDKLTELARTHGPIVALTDNAIFAQRCLVKMANIFDASLLDSEAVKRATIAGARLQM